MNLYVKCETINNKKIIINFSDIGIFSIQFILKYAKIG